MKITAIPQYNNCNYKYNIRYLEKNNSNIVFGADLFNKKALKVAQKQVEQLEAKNATLEAYNKLLEETLKKLRIPGLIEAKDTIENILDNLKKQIFPVDEKFVGIEQYKDYITEKLAGPLNYDPMVPVFNKVDDRKYSPFEKVFEYKEAPAPTSVQKAESNALLINKLLNTHFISFDYTNQNSEIIKNSKAYITGNELGVAKKTPTDMTKKYGKRVGWSDEKIARDLLQNFYDAHGHTLEGTKIDIKKDGTFYKVKISGLSEYEHKHIQYIGAGDKDNDLYNAGGFGEGTKILSAVLLANDKTEKITFSSANWSLDYSLSNNNDDAIIMRELNILETPTKGNYVEFETTDLNLVRKIIDARNYFYHPDNPDFKDLTFENEHWGFKILPKDDGGNLYMTQRFEYETNGAWVDPLKEVVLIFKRRPENAELLGKNRDRINLRSSEIKDVIKKDFAKTMTDEQLVNAILSLEQIWNTKYHRAIKDSVLYDVFSCLADVASTRNIVIDFKDQKMASLYFCFQPEIYQAVEKMGYDILDSKMYYLGAEDVKAVYKKTRLHVPLVPNEVEKKKLMLLEEGIALFAEDKAMNKRITNEESKKPRFIFNAKEAKEENTLAESVVENNVYKGHWVDRKALNKMKFYELLAIWLHEITHKYAGDGTNDFGYKLTDVMGLELESLMNSPERLEKLRYLRSVFNKL